jgi:hypothetical protein
MFLNDRFGELIIAFGTPSLLLEYFRERGASTAHSTHGADVRPVRRESTPENCPAYRTKPKGR